MNPLDSSAIAARNDSPSEGLQSDAQRDITAILTCTVSSGIRDLSRGVQLFGHSPTAEGVNSTIWRGTLNSSTAVAIKLKHPVRDDVIRKKFLREVLREVLVWSHATHHENIMPLLGVARLHDSLALISPWMEGGNLNAYLNAHPNTILEPLLADVACGLAYLHSQDIVYGVLRSTTVLVSPVGRAYLSSFLMAHSLQINNYCLPNGYVLFSDLQESRNDKPIDVGELNTTLESDVFAFGMMVLEVNDPHMSGSRDLREVVRDCLQGIPMRRPTMAEVAKTMVQLAEASILTLEMIQDTASSRTLKDISTEITEVGEHPIAGGGYCDLYLGQSVRSGTVALKLVRLFNTTPRELDAARGRFLSEASLWAGFDHPRILEFCGICQYGPSAFFMVSPYLQNGNIRQYLLNDPDSDRYRLLSETAEGLLYLHNRTPPVLHGDMKGANILITDAGTAVLADFGLSKISDEATTTRLQGAGSPRWMAPELILSGDQPTGPVKTQKSDIYAYGHVMLEVLGDKLPFFNLKEDLHVIVGLIRGERSPRPDGPVADKWLNDGVWLLSQRCTAIDPSERPGIERVISVLNRVRGDTGLRLA